MYVFDIIYHLTINKILSFTYTHPHHPHTHTPTPPTHTHTPTLPTHTHPHIYTQEINAQISTLTQEKRQLLDENNSLTVVLALERDKVTSLSDKKKIAEEEVARLQDKVREIV